VFGFAIDFSKKNWGNTHAKWAIECVFQKNCLKIIKFLETICKTDEAAQPMLLVCFSAKSSLLISCGFITAKLPFVNTAKLPLKSRHAHFSFAYASFDQCCHCCFFSLDLGFFCFIWGSGVFIENLGFFDSGQILEISVVLLYFPFKNTVVTSFTGVNRNVRSP